MLSQEATVIEDFSVVIDKVVKGLMLGEEYCRTILLFLLKYINKKKYISKVNV